MNHKLDITIPFGQSQLNCFCLAVFDGVGDRLLRDTVKMNRHGMIANGHRIRKRANAFHAKNTGDVRRQLRQRCHQTFGFEPDRIQTQRLAARLVNGLTQQLFNLLRVPDFRGIDRRRVFAPASGF